MNRKLELTWGGGSDSFVLSLGNQKFFSYEKDHEILHTTYGGKNYYQSGSGRSGAGFLTPSPEVNDLVEFGSYRTDAGPSHQLSKKVGEPHVTYHRDMWEGETSPKEVFGYVPYASHKGITEGAPFVLTDGTTVGFFAKYEVFNALQNWQRIIDEARHFEKVLWSVSNNGYAFSSSFEWRLYNPNKMRGVDALRFVDLRDYRSQEDLWQLRQDSQPSRTCELLNLYEVHQNEGKQAWVHQNHLKVFDVMLNHAPLTTEGQIGIGSWVGDGQGMLWRRKEFVVETLMEVPWSYITQQNVELDFEGHPSWVDFEIEFSLVEWYSISHEKRRQRLVDGILQKARQLKQYSLPQISLLELMRQNPMVRVCLEDSLKAGNCRVGSEAFIQKFDLRVEEDGCLSIGKLLEHPRFDEMFQNRLFRTVMSFVLGQQQLANDVALMEQYLGPSILSTLVVDDDDADIDPYAEFAEVKDE